MFPSPSKLALLILVAFVVWYAARWISRLPNAMPRRPAASARPPDPAAIEELAACRTCGTYVAADAPGCGKPGCPRPR